MSAETVLTNARIVLEDSIVTGTLVFRDGRVAEISEGSTQVGEDFDGDYLIPGLVELHTDHLEAHYSPRPGVRWDKTSAIQAHDAQVVTSGITTVFDCLRMGSDEDGGFVKGEMREMADAIQAAEREDRLRAEHLIHLRCEVSAEDVLDHFADFETDPYVRLVSLMDHAPGQRQFQTMEQYTLYYKTKRGLSDEAFAHFVARRQEASALYAAPHRDTLARSCAARGITVASHDERNARSCRRGYRLWRQDSPNVPDHASMPRTPPTRTGMSVLMGAPNIVRGKSHSGNIAARDLAERGVLDVLSSDYVPLSLLHAPFVLADELDSISLPQALAMVTSTPARTVGLSDRGRIDTGLRADLVRVRRHAGVPIVRSVWREGRRVA